MNGELTPVDHAELLSRVIEDEDASRALLSDVLREGMHNYNHDPEFRACVHLAFRGMSQMHLEASRAPFTDEELREHRLTAILALQIAKNGVVG